MNRYKYLEAEGMLYAIRLPANKVFRESIAHLLRRSVGRPPNHVCRHYASFRYQARSWERKRRVVAKVEWHPDQLYPTVGLDPLRGSSVTDLSRPAERVVAHGRYVTFQLAEVAVPGDLFRKILRRIEELRPPAFAAG